MCPAACGTVITVTNDQFFPYRLDKRWFAMFAALGVKESDGVHIGADGTFLATFGRAKVSTPLSNIDHTVITGPHRWYTAVGLRLSLADDGITFGTNHRRGVCIEFVEKVPRVIGPRRHSALWVSVADPEALVTAIGR